VGFYAVWYKPYTSQKFWILHENLGLELFLIPNTSIGISLVEGIIIPLFNEEVLSYDY
jgi:hypothetical protein